MKTNIRRVGYFLLLLLLLLIVYLTWLQLMAGPLLAARPENRRLWLEQRAIQRGTILDRNGRPLAYSVTAGNGWQRLYPLGAAGEAVTGYLSEVYGTSGIEGAFNGELLGLTDEHLAQNYLARLLHRPLKGENVVTTIDSGLQQLGYRLLSGRRGAVVALDPRSGAVLALVSSPSFNPQSLEETWPTLLKDANHPLLNRATQGLFPPGSTLKVITETGILEQKPSMANRIFNCIGYLMVDGFLLNDNGVHGRVNLRQALAVSCDTTFAQLGLALGRDSFYRLGQKFFFNRQIPFSLPTATSTIPDPDTISVPELAESAIGQGRVLATPLEMALVAASIANGGVMMQPYLVQGIQDPSTGSLLHRFKPRALATVTSTAIARRVTDDMIAVVKDGTGQRAALTGVEVAGKTGSAENPHGVAHAWFIGFAPARRPQIAVAVVIENGGAGGVAAAPVARQIMAYGLGMR